MTDDPHGYVWIPYVACRHEKANNPYCEPILLPYPNLKAIADSEDIPEEETYPPDWPAGGWSATFGCSSCGYLSQYIASDVRWNLLSKSAPGRFHSGANCFCIEFECAQKNCQLPTKLHIEKKEATEAEIVLLVQSPFFVGSLSCGHEICSLPRAAYKIHRVLGLIE